MMPMIISILILRKYRSRIVIGLQEIPFLWYFYAGYKAVRTDRFTIGWVSIPLKEFPYPNQIMIWPPKLLWCFALVSMFCHTNKMAREIILEEGASHFVLTAGWKSLILNFLNSSSRLSRRTCRRCWSAAGAHILYLHLDIFFSGNVI